MRSKSPSTKNSASAESLADFDWQAAGLRYFAYNFFLRRKFGHRVQRVSVDAGFTCPNVDGTVATGGCTFCDNRSFSPSRRLPRRSITEQIDEGIRRMRGRYDCEHFMAYFQPATNTYAPVDRLRQVYEQAIADPRIVALAIGTRPDCVPDEVLDLLAELAHRTFLSVEYGMQTMHDRSLDWMNRGHHHTAFIDAMQRSRGRGFRNLRHLIVGLPGESRDDILASARELVRLDVDAVKIHNLYAVRNTRPGGAAGTRRSPVDGARRIPGYRDRRLGTASAPRGRRAHQRRRTAHVLCRPGVVPGQAGRPRRVRRRTTPPGHLAGKTVLARQLSCENRDVAR